ncbi:UNVERIFIED_CONTAM: hypothetical protein K2H54_038458 [Gekko kuhli]
MNCLKYIKPLIRAQNAISGHCSLFLDSFPQILTSILNKIDFLCLILGLEILCSETNLPPQSSHKCILLVHMQWNNRYLQLVKLAVSLFQNTKYHCQLSIDSQS